MTLTTPIRGSLSYAD